ncbi:MAG: biopolymer transporter ExbD [Myxococcota bacterium]
MMKKGRAKDPKEMNLNITSLMDVLTIVLIFLLVSFSSQEEEITPPKDFALPASDSERPPKLAIKVSIGENAIHIEDNQNPVVQLRKGEFIPSDMNKDKLVEPLLRELKKEKARLASQASTDDEEGEDEVIYFEAARGTKYYVIERIMKTAAQAGFVKFRLAVNRNV